MPQIPSSPVVGFSSQTVSAAKTEIIGINRCGSSSLHYNLGQHAQIFFTRDSGEERERLEGAELSDALSSLPLPFTLVPPLHEDNLLLKHRTILPRKEDVQAGCYCLREAEIGHDDCEVFGSQRKGSAFIRCLLHTKLLLADSSAVLTCQFRDFARKAGVPPLRNFHEQASSVLSAK